MKEALEFIVELFTPIMALIGARNGFSIVATIFMVRMYRAVKWRDPEDIKSKVKQYAVTIGAGTILVTTDLTTVADWTTSQYIVLLQEVMAGVFFTYFGSFIFYELVRFILKMLIAWRHNKWGERELKQLYWFLSPAKVRIRQKNKTVVELEPDESLTTWNKTIFEKRDE